VAASRHRRADTEDQCKKPGKFGVASDTPEDVVKQAELASDVVRLARDGSTIRKVIVVPGHIVNVVVRCRLPVGGDAQASMIRIAITGSQI
jgi:leucyl-tRNA synthetase